MAEVNAINAALDALEFTRASTATPMPEPAVLHAFVNGKELRTTEFEPHETLLDFLRGE